MTLIGGCRTSDGFVLSADTEIAYGSVNFQNTKPQKYFSERFGYTLYHRWGWKRVLFPHSRTAHPRCGGVTAIAHSQHDQGGNRKDILDIHDRWIVKYWPIDSEERPSFDLIVGASVKNGSNVDSLLVRTDDVAVAEIGSFEFIGSGSPLAEHVAEKMLVTGLSTARTVHLLAQSYRELKGKGEAVGAIRKFMHVESAKMQSTFSRFQPVKILR
jgi:hypothetical protein